MGDIVKEDLKLRSCSIRQRRVELVVDGLDDDVYSKNGVGPEEHPKSAIVKDDKEWLVMSSRVLISFLRSASAASMAPLYTRTHK